MGNTPSTSSSTATTTSFSIPSRPFDRHGGGNLKSCFRAMVVMPRRRIPNSTTLMQLILLKDWQRVLIRAALFPHEVDKPCIVKLYDIKWKVLPLHLACALKPPTKVIAVLARKGLASRPVERRKSKLRRYLPKSLPKTKAMATDDRKELLSQRDFGDGFPYNDDDLSVSTSATNYSEGPWVFNNNIPGKASSLVSLEQSIGDKSRATPTVDGSSIHRGNSLCSFLDKTGVFLQLTESGGVSPMPVTTTIPQNDTLSMTDTKQSLDLVPDPLLRAASTHTLLPIHIACLYQASPSVIQLLLQEYPMGALSGVAGMLPVHLVAAGWMIAPIEFSHETTTPYATLMKLEEVWDTTQALRVMHHEFPEVLSAKSAHHRMSPIEYVEGTMEEGTKKDACLEFLKHALEDLPVKTEKSLDITQDTEGNTEMVPVEIHCLSSLSASTIVPSESTLYNLFLERNWQEAMHLLESDPKLAREWHYGIDKGGAAAADDDPVLWKRLALHLACAVAAPPGLVELLIQLYPQAIGCEDPHNGSIPLHLACQFGASLPVIRSLIEARTASTKAVDARGRLPLHCAILAAAPYTTIELLVQHDPAAVLCPDQEGKTPLQYSHYSYPEGSPVVGLLEVVWM